MTSSATWRGSYEPRSGKPSVSGTERSNEALHRFLHVTRVTKEGNSGWLPRHKSGLLVGFNIREAVSDPAPPNPSRRRRRIEVIWCRTPIDILRRFASGPPLREPPARHAATRRGHTRRCVRGTPGSIGRSNAFHKVVRHASQFLDSGRCPISHARRALVQRRRWVRDGCVPCSSTNLSGSAASPQELLPAYPETGAETT